MNKAVQELDKNNIPNHVAIIMDGNGRWAKGQGKERTVGHQFGVKSVRECVEASIKIGVKYLTLYAFSTENWQRPQEEVSFLMNLLVDTLAKEIEELNKQGVRITAIGDIDSLPEHSKLAIESAKEYTKNNDTLHLVLAVSYSSKWEITQAIKSIAEEVVNNNISIDSINHKLIDDYLNTKGIPEPELLIRTSGEKRISNFLLWQLAYAEFYFTDEMWPDFNQDSYYQAIKEYQKRERRFGKTSKQMKGENITQNQPADY